MKKVKILLVFIALFALLLLFTGCAEKCNHEYSEEWTTDVEATCTTEGSKSHHCINCGDATDVTVVPINGVHNVEGGYCQYCNRKESSLGLEYSENPDGTYSVTGIGSCTDSEIVIDIFNNRDVVSIANYAFRDCKQMTGVEISDSVEEIGQRAFLYCINLVNLKLGSGAQTIEKSTFYGCASLTEVIIPEGVITIENLAFDYCDNIVRITIPASVTKMPEYGYENCSSKMKEIIVSEGNNEYKSIDGNLYSKDGTKLIKYAPGKTEASFTVPSHVTEICDFAFAYSKSLTELIIPEGVTHIGEQCLYFCDNLVNISIPNSLTYVGGLSAFDLDFNFNEYDNAYYLGNSSNPYLVLCRAKHQDIESCIINERTRFIQGMAFWGCDNLTSMVITDSITVIPSSMFGHCSGLTSIVIPDSITEIDYGAFYECTNLTSVFIPESVIYVDNRAFVGCPNLTVYAEVQEEPKTWYENFGWLDSEGQNVWVGWLDPEATVVWGTTLEDMPLAEEGSAPNP